MQKEHKNSLDEHVTLIFTANPTELHLDHTRRRISGSLMVHWCAGWCAALKIDVVVSISTIGAEIVALDVQYDHQMGK